MNELELENLIAALTGYINKAAETYKNKLDPSYDLYNEVSGSVEHENDIYNAVLTLGEAWKHIEYGIKKGTKPPVDVIRDWIRRKNIIPLAQTVKTGEKIIPTDKQFTFLVGRKIAEHGVPARNYLAQTVDELRKELFTKVIEALKKDVTKELLEAFAGD